ncbi:TSUP family transporter [Saccharopolyspora erythraea]|uniref:TSUP family transporter n=1 Tax=Saccharopolyspora erythraea TaxID=1836 RepID=UPI001BA5B89C|nr:TSUP family transporter [Saccharopolyspora erythraea]QUH02759.1 TSUP family transporter [Saccharopolyspora erythraea]
MSPVVMFGLAGLVVLVGAVVQGGAGLGMNLLAAPLLTLVDRALVPVPLLVASLVLALMAMRREFGHVDWRGTSFAVAGRLPGTALGVYAVAALPVRGFSMTIGVLVLVCLVLSVVSWRPKPTPAALLAAGFAGGAMGTASSIGAPPVALLYQHESGPRIRATLSAYIVFGSVLSLVALGLGGQIGSPQIFGSLLLLPFMAAGFALSGPLRRHLDAGWMRPCVLALAGGSAVLLIVRSL